MAGEFLLKSPAVWVFIYVLLCFAAERNEVLLPVTRGDKTLRSWPVIVVILRDWLAGKNKLGR